MRKIFALTAGSKIIRALQIIRVKKLILIQFYKIKICQVIIFRLYTIYNKLEIKKKKRSNQTGELTANNTASA